MGLLNKKPSTPVCAMCGNSAGRFRNSATGMRVDFDMRAMR
jgi:hypothetical protein